MRHNLFARIICASCAALAATALTACATNPSSNTIKVYKSDQSQQCMNNAISPEDMHRELVSAGIDVMCMQKNSDGMMHAAVCGGETGAINVYVIDKDGLPDAKALGYSSVSELPNYQDKPCAESFNPPLPRDE